MAIQINITGRDVPSILAIFGVMLIVTHIINVTVGGPINTILLGITGVILLVISIILHLLPTQQNII